VIIIAITNGNNLLSTFLQCILYAYVPPFTDHLQLKNEAVSLVDVIAPPDFILPSPIGSSSGEV